MGVIQDRLFQLRDAEYKKFHSSLIPTVKDELIIGIRVPELRKFAKSLFKDTSAFEFMDQLPHEFYEENNLHAFLIEQISDYDLAIKKTNEFLPYVDNWSTCDMFNPKVFRTQKERFLKQIKQWIKSKHTYTIRFAILMLMRYYIDNADSCRLVLSVQSDDYYVNMMKAWYFATGLSYDFLMFIPYITENKLSTWVHNKTIQKAIESHKISNQQKEVLKKYRIGRVRL